LRLLLRALFAALIAIGAAANSGPHRRRRKPGCAWPLLAYAT